MGHLSWQGDYGVLKALPNYNVPCVQECWVCQRESWKYFSLQKGGGSFFQFLDHHNFHIHDQNLADRVYLDSMHQELSIDMLHDILFPYQFESQILFEFKIQNIAIGQYIH